MYLGVYPVADFEYILAFVFKRGQFGSDEKKTFDTTSCISHGRTQGRGLDFVNSWIPFENLMITSKSPNLLLIKQNYEKVVTVFLKKA